jgi:hypothetical protein
MDQGRRRHGLALRRQQGTEARVRAGRRTRTRSAAHPHIRRGRQPSRARHDALRAHGRQRDCSHPLVAAMVGARGGDAARGARCGAAGGPRRLARSGAAGSDPHPRARRLPRAARRFEPHGRTRLSDGHAGAGAAGPCAGGAGAGCDRRPIRIRRHGGWNPRRYRVRGPQVARSRRRRGDRLTRRGDANPGAGAWSSSNRRRDRRAVGACPPPHGGKRSPRRRIRARDGGRRGRDGACRRARSDAGPHVHREDVRGRAGCRAPIARKAVLYWHTLSSRPLEPLLAAAPQTLPPELAALLPRAN